MIVIFIFSQRLSIPNRLDLCLAQTCPWHTAELSRQVQSIHLLSHSPSCYLQIRLSDSQHLILRLEKWNKVGYLFATEMRGPGMYVSCTSELLCEEFHAHKHTALQKPQNSAKPRDKWMVIRATCRVPVSSFHLWRTINCILISRMFLLNLSSRTDVIIRWRCSYT